MAAAGVSMIQARREEIVDAHIEAEAVQHDVGSTLATFRHPRYEVPALAGIADGSEAVTGLIGAIFSAFPDFYLHKKAQYHAGRLGSTTRQLC